MEAKGGEVRRLHIIYFLSHTDGRAEHPHLIRVLHLARNGVYLRDIKRWLGEWRGKDLAETFAWSYKRRYKSGYVWQDLMDDDLITPISDNEYVLKGSQIHSTPFETSSPNEKKTDTTTTTTTDVLVDKKSSQVQVEEDKNKNQSEVESQIQQDNDDSLVFSSERSSVTDDDSSKVEEEKLLGTDKEGLNLNEKNNVKLESFSLPSLYHNLMSKKGNKKDSSKNGTPNSTISTPSPLSSSSSQSPFSKIRSNSSRVSNVFRNWISCGTVETNDAAMVLMKSANRIVTKEPINMPEKRAEICKGDKLGGSARCFGTPWNYDGQNEHYGARKSCDEGETDKSRKKLGELMNQAPYKPFCSQCGKLFKPEEMHKHMKSCKGMKAMGTSAITTAEETQLQRSASSYKDYLFKNSI